MPRKVALWACLLIASLATADTTYTVRSGDTLEGIAKRTGVSQSAIQKANPNLRPTRLQIGQKLHVPSSSKSSAPSSSQGRSNGGTYVVRNGDNDTTIARRYGVSVEALHSLNPGVSWRRLQIGQRLSVPGAAASSSAPTRPAKVAVKAGGTYKVVKGDNDWMIARRFGLTPSQLRTLNPGVDFRRLQIGAALKVPGAGKSTVASKSPGGTRITTRNAVISASAAIVRRTPSATGERVVNVPSGTVAKILDRSGDWYKLRFPKGTEGWVRNDLLKPSQATIATVAATTKAPASKPSKPTTRPAPRTTGDLAVLDRARGYMGVRYRWGGTSRSGFDCSGFVQAVYRSQGVSLPRTSVAQSQVGTAVAKANLQKGDLVFFRTRGNRISHVGIYQGGGKFIHASSGGGKVEIDSLSSGYYARRFAGARRVSNNLKSSSRKSVAAAKAPAAMVDPDPKPEVAKREDAPSRVQIGADEVQN